MARELTMISRRARSSFRRVARLVISVLLVTELVYIVVANSFLRFGGVEKLLSSTNDIQVHFRHAWTLLPGRFHAEGVRVLFQDHNLEWSLDLRSVDFRLSLPALFSKTFHATEVRGSGAVFRMRQRVSAKNAGLASTAALAPIPEFETPALMIYYVPGPTRTDLWKVHLEDVDVGVSELWVQQFRYLGSGRARGAFRLHAGYHLWVGPASLELEPGPLRAGDRLLASRFFGRIECVVHPFYVDVPVGREVFRQISAKIDLHGDDLRLNSLDLFLPPETGLYAPAAKLDIAVGADHGVFSAESRIRVEGPLLGVSARGAELRGRRFELEARALREGFAEANLSFESGIARRLGERRARIRVGPTSFAIANQSLDTTGDWRVAGADLVVSKGEVPLLSDLDAYSQKYGLALRAGGARFELLLHQRAGALSGAAWLALNKAQGSLRTLGWELDGEIALAMGRARTEALGDGNFEATVRLRRAAFTLGSSQIALREAGIFAHASLDAHQGGGSLHADFGELELRREPQALRAHGNFRLRVDSVDLDRRTAEAHADAELSEIEGQAGKLSVRAAKLTLHSDAKLGPDRVTQGAVDLDLSQLVLRSLEDASCDWVKLPKLEARAQLALSAQGAPRIGLYAKLQNARARWGDFSAQGDVTLSADRAREGAALSLHADAERLELTSGKTQNEGWQAAFPRLRLVAALDPSETGLSGPIRLRADAVRGRIGKARVHADLGIDAELRGLDRARGQAFGSAALRIDHAGLLSKGFGVEDWWGRVHLPFVRVDVGDNVDLSGEFGAKLRDGLPALDLFASEGHLPSWLPELLPLRELEARGDFRKRCHLTDISVRSADGGPLVSAGRIQSEPSDVRAAFLVELRDLPVASVGLLNYEDDVHYRLLAGDSWLREQTERMNRPAADSCPPEPKHCPD